MQQMPRHDTPFGPLTLAASEAGLTRCTFGPTSARARPGRDSAAARDWLRLARTELDEYFAGRRRAFTVPADLTRVPEPRRAVLAALAGRVGHGETTTYGELAAALGLPGPDAARMVGGAMAANPVHVIVPCHRVLGAGGKLVGYAGGLEVKRALLDLESPVPALF
jgi:methylated-DNA-[protein]-cysteine S-methyltransferase